MTCCICGAAIQGYPHNPYPVCADGGCCDECNLQVVLPARLKMMGICDTYDIIKQQHKQVCRELEAAAIEECTAAYIALEEAMRTPRGTSEARTEAKQRREHAMMTHTCANCGGEATSDSYDGYCKACSEVIRRMHVFKSVLSTGCPQERRLRRFVEDYRQISNPPASLRGNTTREDVLAKATKLLDLIVLLEDLKN